jgi:hypothetical protein
VGLIVLGVGALAFLLASTLGLGGLVAHARLRQTSGRGSWPLYFTIASVVGLACLNAGWSFMPAIEGAPSGEDYEAAIRAYALFAAAPGTGFLAGALALLKRPAAMA